MEIMISSIDMPANFDRVIKASPVATYLLRLKASSRAPVKSNFMRLLKIIAPEIIDKAQNQLESLGYARNDAIYLFSWHRLQKAHIQFLYEQLTSLYPAKLVRSTLSALRQILYECHVHGLITLEDYRSLTDIPCPKIIATPAGRAVNPQEIDRLIKNCLDDRPIGIRDAAILTIFKTGTRIQEVVCLNLADLNLKERRIYITYSKTNRRRFLYIPIEDQRLLMNWIALRGQEPGPLFVTMLGGTNVYSLNRLGVDAIRVMLAKRIQAVGLETFTPHDIRRGIITALLDRGTEPKIVQDIAGHTSPDTTLNYYDRRDPSVQQRAIESINFPFPN